MYSVGTRLQTSIVLSLINSLLTATSTSIQEGVTVYIVILIKSKSMR